MDDPLLIVLISMLGALVLWVGFSIYDTETKNSACVMKGGVPASIRSGPEVCLRQPLELVK